MYHVFIVCSVSDVPCVRYAVCQMYDVFIVCNVSDAPCVTNVMCQMYHVLHIVWIYHV